MDIWQNTLYITKGVYFHVYNFGYAYSLEIIIYFTYCPYYQVIGIHQTFHLEQKNKEFLND